MQFEFESECGLKVIHTSEGLRCVLSEVDARIHGRAAYYSPLPRHHDPTNSVRQAGWNKYDYDLYQWEEKGRQAEVQLADLFDVCLYMATIPKDKESRRRSVYSSVCQTLEVSEVGPYELMDQVEWDLELLHGKLRGADGFPSDVASTSPIALPENKTIQFPLQLYEKAYYRKIYDAASRDFLAAYPVGPKKLSLVSYPDAADQRTWSCPSEGCAATATTPAVMLRHLAGHSEYESATVFLGTVRFQTKAGTANVLKTKKTVHKDQGATAKRQRSSQAASKSGKRAKPDTVMEQMLELVQKQNDKFDLLQASMMKSNEEKDSQMCRFLTLQENRDAKQEKRDDAMLQLITSLSARPAIEANPNPVSSSHDQEETLRRFMSFQQMTRGSLST